LTDPPVWPGVTSTASGPAPEYRPCSVPRTAPGAPAPHPAWSGQTLPAGIGPVLSGIVRPRNAFLSRRYRYWSGAPALRTPLISSCLGGCDIGCTHHRGGSGLLA